MLPNIIYYLAAKAAKHLFPLSTAATNWILKNGIGYPAVLDHVDFSMETVLYFFLWGGGWCWEQDAEMHFQCSLLFQFSSLHTPVTGMRPESPAAHWELETSFKYICVKLSFVFSFSAMLA